MKPILCKYNETVEIEGRWFTVFIDCIIESIDDKIMVSDYEMFRNRPMNTRENTQEVMEVFTKHHPKGSSRTVIEVLSQYTRCKTNDAIGKTVLRVGSNGLVIFTDKTYLPDIDYEDGALVFINLAINELRFLGLLNTEIINKIKDEERQLAEIKNKSRGC